MEDLFHLTMSPREINQSSVLTLSLYLCHLLRIINIKKPVIIARRAKFQLAFISREIDILVLV